MLSDTNVVQLQLTIRSEGKTELNVHETLGYKGLREMGVSDILLQMQTFGKSVKKNGNIFLIRVGRQAVVYDLKIEGHLEYKLVAPMSEQIKITVLASW